MAGVTSTGFEAKRLADVLSDAEAELALIVDPVSGESLQPDFGSEDPAIQVVKVPLDAVGSAWEAAQLVFDQFDPNKATGASLSALVELNGLLRQPATASIATLTLSGTPGTVIPAGSLISDVDNTYQWATTTSATLSVMGLASVAASNITYGPIAAAAGTLNTIVTPIAGWTGVTNGAAASLGSDVETDRELRQRRSISTLAPASGPIESVYANLANLPGVTYVRVYQNNTLSVDARGIPPKTVAAVLVGGADLAIAQVLLARTGVSAGWYGTTTVTLYDIQNEPYAVSFSRPTPVPIYVEVAIEITNPSVFPGDGVQQIKDAIVAYAQGGAPALGVTDGFSETGFPPGAPIITSRLYTPVNFVPGHRVVYLLADDAYPPIAVGNTPMVWNQYGFFTQANINVIVM